jgi:hypothetical protein
MLLAQHVKNVGAKKPGRDITLTQPIAMHNAHLTQQVIGRVVVIAYKVDVGRILLSIIVSCKE